MEGPIILVAGARPNFMKIAPLYKVFKQRSINTILLHSGQHYDANMSQIFFDDLGIPAPDIHLEVGSGSHAVQTAAVMVAFEEVCFEHKPSMVVVVGDVNSTIACAIVAAKLHIPCAHVEAGLRSGDMKMPEEVNRVLTDRICSILLTPSPDGDDNLLAEGVPAENIHMVGNVMIDSLLSNLEKAKASGIVERLGLVEGEYATLTMHRPGNVDDEAVFTSLVETLEIVSSSIQLVFPMHPRTRARAESFGLMERLESLALITEPLGYHEFQGLIASSKLVLTDSGGLQEETTALGIPCLTMRPNTERPITITEGTNIIVGSDQAKILSGVEDILSGQGKAGRIPYLWDGKAAERMADVIIGHIV
ncbi:MAG: UDP-N-acetylglucosamine 2-epimerase (non-hydrolyzing) [Euryarchaeota archaeon]|nr:UDP-N-acetylglucosamine 2-epimerase (non-hydrolyzing) [Euryarchaeota archaeon]